MAWSLHRAAGRGNVRQTAVLLASGVAVNRKDQHGRTPLHAAVRGGHKAVAQQLLDAGAYVATADHKGQSPLHAAAAGGGPGVLDMLIAAGAPVSAVDGVQCTPLHYAAGHANGSTAAFKLVKSLLSHGADVAAADIAGETPLHHAARAGSTAALHALLKAGAAVLAACNQGHTALHAAAAANDSGPCMAVLLAAGAPVNAVDSQGLTPLLTAVRKASSAQHSPQAEAVPAVRRLLEAGADVTIADSNGRTLLMHAALGRAPAVLQLLLAQPGIAAKDIIDASLAAANAGRLDAVIVLLQALQRLQAEAAAPRSHASAAQPDACCTGSATAAAATTSPGSGGLRNLQQASSDATQPAALPGAHTTGSMQQLSAADASGKDATVPEPPVALSSAEVHRQQPGPIQCPTAAPSLRQSGQPGATLYPAASPVPATAEADASLCSTGPNSAGHSISSLRHTAAAAESLDVVRNLIPAGGTVDAQDCDERTPLQPTVQQQPFEADAVQQLVAAGAAAGAANNEGLTPLTLAAAAAETGRQGVVQLLLAAPSLGAGAISLADTAAARSGCAGMAQRSTEAANDRVCAGSEITAANPQVEEQLYSILRHDSDVCQQQYLQNPGTRVLAVQQPQQQQQQQEGQANIVLQQSAPGLDVAAILQGIKQEPGLAAVPAVDSNGAAAAAAGSVDSARSQSCIPHAQKPGSSSSCCMAAAAAAAAAGTVAEGAAPAPGVPGPCCMQLLQRAAAAGLGIPNQQQLDYYLLADESFVAAELQQLHEMNLAPMLATRAIANSNRSGRVREAVVTVAVWHSRVQHVYPSLAPAVLKLRDTVPELSGQQQQGQKNRPSKRQKTASTASAAEAAVVAIAATEKAQLLLLVGEPTGAGEGAATAAAAVAVWRPAAQCGGRGGGG